MTPLYNRLWDLQLGRCWLCCKPMSMRDPKDDPKAATMDHLVPLSRGGVNKPRNKLLAHSKCNGRRYNPQVWTPTGVLRKLALQRIVDAVSDPDSLVVSTSAAPALRRASRGTKRAATKRLAAALPEEVRPFPLRVSLAEYSSQHRSTTPQSAESPLGRARGNR